MTRITLVTDTDSLCLQGHDTWRADTPLLIRKDGIKGLYGTPQARESALDRPQQDGAYWPSRITQGARTISIDCYARGLSSIEVMRLVDRINALFGRPLVIIVEDAHGTRELTGYLAADPEPLMTVRQSGFSFGLVITCPDPYKYGALVWYDTDGAWCAVSNPGTVASWPLIECAGPLTRLRVALDDGEIDWVGSSSKGFTLDTRTMLVDEGRVSLDRSFPIRPGASRLRVESDSPRVRVGVRPAWR